MILLRRLHLSQQAPVQFQRSGQVIESLLEVAGPQVSLPKLSVGCHEHEEVFSVHVDEQLAQGQLLDSGLNRTLHVLLRREFI